MPTLESEVKAGRLSKAMKFNEKVWALTVRIPAGKVVTYRQIAEKLCSRGYRAVGNAMNRNPYAPQVPCHRVVGSNGSLTGYALGVEKKRAMLMKEGVTFVGEKVNLKESAFSL